MFYAKYPLAVSLAAFALTQQALAADTPAEPESAQYEKLLTRAELSFKNGCNPHPNPLPEGEGADCG